MQTSGPYFDRDLSWLSFNYRILQEAANPTLPLYDRIRFLAIYSSNSDEFFRVRVAALRSARLIAQNAPAEELDNLLDRIRQQVKTQQHEYGQIYREQLLPALAQNGIVLYPNEHVEEAHQAEIRHYFRSRVLTYLQPVIFLEKIPPPFLKNRRLYFFIRLRRKDQPQGAFQYALLNIPSHHLPRFRKLSPQNGKQYFIFLDDIIRANMAYVFPGYEIEEAFSIKLNRDAGLHLDDEFAGDLIDKIRTHLHLRNLGLPSRFLYDAKMPEAMRAFLQNVYEISEEDAVPGGRYHNFFDFMGFPNPLKPALEEGPWPALNHLDLDAQESMLEAIAHRDYLLHFPYHSYDYVLRFFNEAAIDPHVTEIKLTVYRVASESFIANALISAARNGKKVSVFVEVKARFDEENNLRWAEMLQKEGVKITYSIPGLKVHAKVALVIRKKNGLRQEFAFMGTGNFNESTAKIYGDHGLFTAHREMTAELNHVFKFLNKRKPVPELKHLLVSQFNILPRFAQLIDREILKAKQGGKGRIIIKINNLEDIAMIDKLYEASRAGVEIDLIVRGICCLVPGVAGQSEHIRVRRIVDRYLEHARVFVFENGGKPEVYLGSADWMRRNLYYRVEVVFPVYEPTLKAEVLQIIDFQLQDNQKATWLNADLQNISFFPEEGQPLIRSQEATYQWLAHKNSETG
ncbi:MAG: RNA degradosome polyphosphate kinase [Microscillaceae bacterium]